MFGDWKVQLLEEPGMVGYKLYLHSTTLNHQKQFLTKGGLEIETIEEAGVPVDKDLSFCHLNHDQLKAIVEAFSEKGFKTSNDHKIEGLLKATNKHLEDMRTLVFKGVKK